MSPRNRRAWFAVAASIAAVVCTSPIQAAFLTLATARLVTNTTGGLNQNASIDKSGKLILFTSNVDHVHTSGTIFSESATFDFDSSGNGFTPAGATHPNPACTNCSTSNATAGNLYLWRASKKGSSPANSVKQLTFSATGGFTANQAADLNQKGTFVAWDSDRDHTGGNGDGNREIFLMEIATGTPTQITSTTGNGDTANRSASLSSDAKTLGFDSRGDFAGPSCTLTDLVSPCDNADGNSEIMVYKRDTGKFIQVTKTTGGTSQANVRARVSDDGRFVAFQSTRSFAGSLAGGIVCTQLDGVSACDNADANGEIMLVDLKDNLMTQVTNTAPGGGCTGTTANERAEVSTRGGYVSFQSTCEAQLNPSGCGACNNNDEVFLANIKKKTIQQLTISDAGYNRVPRVSGNGTYVVFESNRSYKTQNPSHGRTIYLLRRSNGRAPTGQTAPGQVIEDGSSALLQNAKAQISSTAFSGGFNSAIEQFGVSFNGRFVAFDNQKNVGNQEIFFVDGKK